MIAPLLLLIVVMVLIPVGFVVDAYYREKEGR